MYQIRSQVYLDKFEECYRDIVVITPRPTNPVLESITKPIRRERLSPFDYSGPCCEPDACIYAFLNPTDRCKLLCVKDIATLFGFLISNGFTINTDITKMMQDSDVKIPKLICFVS